MKIAQGKITQDANSIAPPRATKARDIIEISFNRNATKHSHDSIVHHGARVHSSKVQRMMSSPDDMNQSSNAANLKSTFTGMTAQDADIQRTSSYYISQDGERLSSIVKNNPIAPIGQSIVMHNVTRGNASSNTDAPGIRPKGWTGKNAKKGKSRASTCSKIKKREDKIPKKRKDNIPIDEQCRRTPCKDRGTNANHRHKECRFKRKDQ